MNETNIIMSETNAKKIKKNADGIGSNADEIKMDRKEAENNLKSNIILIGMPSSGKSTIGKSLAEKLNADFIDTDNLLRESQKKELREIVIKYGHEYFLKVQEEEILKLEVENSVIATGGSVVYSENIMNHLRNMGYIVYLQIQIDELMKRINSERRFAKKKDQSFEELYNERVPLYEKYADFIVNCTNKNIDAIVDAIINGIAGMTKF